MATEVLVDMGERGSVWLKPKAAAAHYGVSRRTIYHWIDKGALEKTTVGGKPKTGVRVKCDKR